MMLREAQTTGFAIPSNLMKQVVPELVEHGRIIMPWHGLFGRMLDPGLAALLQLPIVEGFLIETVEPGSPAERLGLRGGALPVQLGMQTFLLGGDIITELDEKTLTDMNEILAIVAGFNVGQVVKLKYLRPGQGFQTASVTLVERPVLPGDLPH